jgi:signal peptidase II
MHSKRLRTLLIILLLASTIGCDQISKRIVRQQLDADHPVSLLAHHFTLTRIENTGAFLSFGYDWPDGVRLVLLTILPCVVLAVAFSYLLRKQNLAPVTLVGICFVVGGGIGNLFDRIVYGSVTDFMHLSFGMFQTGIFNMADVAITTGVLMIFFSSLVRPRRWTAGHE